MDITFWGVRGSYPVPGAATVRYGGQTSCVEVRADSGARVILDAGTGLRALGQRISRSGGGVPERHHILLSHVHWDHIQGLPFFEPAYVPGTEIAVYSSVAAADELRPVIAGITRHEFFPMPLESVPAQFTFHEVEPGLGFTIGEFQVMPIALNHPFGAVGYRITADGSSVAYIADTAPFTEVLHKRHFLNGLEPLTNEDRATLGQLRADLVRSLRDCDTVVYDTHFLPHEYEKFPHYGHSTPDHGLEICAASGVRCLVLYHHAPSHDDDMMDDLAADYRQKGAAAGVDIVTAREGMVLAVGAPA